MRQFDTAARTFLVIVCAIGGAGCSSGERLLQADATPTVAGPTIARSGIEGLKQDIAWARSLPPSATLGTSTGTISRDELVSTLETALQRLTGAPRSPRFAMSPSAPRLDLSPGDVGGGSTIYYLYTDAQGLRWVKLFAYTTCNQGSMVVAKIELHAGFWNFQTGTYFGPWPIIGAVQSAPNYVSNSAAMGVGGTLELRAAAHNKHTCEFGESDKYPFKYSDPWTVI